MSGRTHAASSLALVSRRCLVVLTVCCAVSSLHVEAARQLFLDPTALSQIENAVLHVNPPQEREVVIRPDRPWEQLMISFFLTVRDEEGKLRMWYICRDKANQPNVAYAESQDGLHWTKPNLGIVEYDGNKENNLVGMSSLEGVVFRDPNAPAPERYAYITHLVTEGMVRFHSPDGLHWQRDAVPIVGIGADTQNVTFWDERLRKYVLYLRGWYRGADKKNYRKVVRTETSSIITPLGIAPLATSLRMWGKDKVTVFGEELPMVFAADEKDPKNSDVYNISAQPYPLDGQWYLGFPSMFQRERNTSDGRLEMHCIGSRDGVTWHRYDRTPYVTPGLADSDSASMIYMGTGMVVRGDEIWQYGTGFRSRHGDREARQQRTDGVIYRYVQRVDGFVSLDLAEEGVATTAPVKVDGAHLLLNVDTAALGHLRVGLLDESGKPLEGFGVDDADIVRTNSTHAQIAWKGRDDLTTLAGQMVRLRFQGSRTKLYSYRFE